MASQGLTGGLPQPLVYLVVGLVVFHALVIVYWAIGALRTPSKVKGGAGPAALSASICVLTCSCRRH